MPHVQPSHSTHRRDLRKPRSSGRQASTTEDADAAAAAAAVEHDSDKFTVRLKPSELMKLGRLFGERLRLTPHE